MDPFTVCVITDIVAHMRDVTAGRVAPATDAPPPTVIVPEAFDLVALPKQEADTTGLHGQKAQLYPFKQTPPTKGAARVAMQLVFRINDVAFERPPLPLSPPSLTGLKADGSIPPTAWSPKAWLVLPAFLTLNKHAAQIDALRALDKRVAGLLSERRAELLPTVAEVCGTADGAFTWGYEPILKPVHGGYVVQLEVNGWTETLTSAQYAPSGREVESCTFETVDADWVPSTKPTASSPPITTFKVALPAIEKAALTAVVPRTTGDVLTPGMLLKDNGAPLTRRVSPGDMTAQSTGSVVFRLGGLRKSQADGSKLRAVVLAEIIEFTPSSNPCKAAGASASSADPRAATVVDAVLAYSAFFTAGGGAAASSSASAALTSPTPTPRTDKPPPPPTKPARFVPLPADEFAKAVKGVGAGEKRRRGDASAAAPTAAASSSEAEAEDVELTAFPSSVPSHVRELFRAAQAALKASMNKAEDEEGAAAAAPTDITA